MKHYRSTFILAVILIAASSYVQAQALIHTTVSKFHAAPAEFGRDFWITEMTNYWGQSLGHKQLRLFITSSNNTTAFISYQGKKTPLPISANSVRSFLMPNFWEMESSGVVEHKGIHVWSNDANLIVYSMNENQDNGSEGERIISTNGWGADYVVAAYSSFHLVTGSYVYDLPSIMAIVADQDHTTVTITPSCDCRTVSQTFNYPAGVPITITMNRGDSYQLMPRKVTDSGIDMTGTIIHASNPVGVFAGSVAANIPENVPYINRVEEMMLPVSRWGTMYFGSTFPSYGIGNDSALYLLASSTPDQTITAHHCNLPDRRIAIADQYGVIWTEQSYGVTFTSDAPFECVEYSNSSLYPDTANGNIYPSETILTPREDFSNTVQAIVPTFGDVFRSYASIVVNSHDETHAFFDGHPLNTVPAACLDTNWELFTVNNISIYGLHQVTGTDSGTTMTIYGYGNYETYSWSGTSKIDDIDYSFLHDTVPPVVDTSGLCLNAFVHLVDSGGVNSGISNMGIDSQTNMEFLPDADFVPSVHTDTTGYGVSVFDPTRPAFLQIEVYDGGGNQVRVTSTYTPVAFELTPNVQNLGAQFNSSIPNHAFDTVVNTGTVPISLSDIHLLNGNRGFSLYDSIGGPIDRSSLAPGKRRIIQVQFISKVSSTVFDTIVVGNGCVSRLAALVGAGGRNDFLVTSQTWPVEPPFPPDSGYIEEVQILNLSSTSIMIDSVGWNDRIHFIPAEHGNGSPYNTLPITLPPAPSTTPFYIAYYSDAFSQKTVYKTEGIWTSPQVVNSGVKVPHFDSLTTDAIPVEGTFSGDTTVNDTCLEIGSTIVIPVTITAPTQNPFTLRRVTQSATDGSFIPLVGMLPFGGQWNPADSEETLFPGESATILVRYAAPPGISFSATDTLIAYDTGMNPIADSPVIVTVNGVYRQFSVPATLDLGMTPFQRPPLSSSFLLTNIGTSPLEVDAVAPEQTKYSSAFSLTTVPEFPASIQPGATMTVTVSYNDTLFGDPFQEEVLNYLTDACTFSQTIVSIQIGGAGVTQDPHDTRFATVRSNGNALDISMSDNTKGHFEFFNVLGTCLLRNDLRTPNETLDVGMLPAGVYFWRIVSDAGSQSGKIILNR